MKIRNADLHNISGKYSEAYLTYLTRNRKAGLEYAMEVPNRSYDLALSYKSNFPSTKDFLITEFFSYNHNCCQIRTTEPHEKFLSLFEIILHDLQVADLLYHSCPTFLVRFAVEKRKLNFF